MTDPIIEAMAKAMCVSDCGDVDYWSQYIPDAKAAYLAALPMIAEEYASIASHYIINGNSIHPDIAANDMSEQARMIAHTTCQYIADAIRDLAAAKVEELSHGR